ncbi:site-specific integrase [Deinococcus multiflagellatus]|uniref:Site-specific integrase n=1 Tax=Deinococcus multiflagellatus TaxID=1656887 RepID=A0ABW1ZSI2_9DEIO
MELLACDVSPLTIKAYADQLKSFLNALAPLGIAWDAVRSDQVRDHILWMKRATKTNRIPRGLTSPVPGSLNPQTGKPYLPTTYQPTTINHRLTVITGFYQHHIGRGTFAPPTPPGRPCGGASPITTQKNAGLKKPAHRTASGSRKPSRGISPTPSGMRFSTASPATGTAPSLFSRFRLAVAPGRACASVCATSTLETKQSA